MPPAGRWSLRSALIYLTLGLPLGGVLLAWRSARSLAVPLLPLHVEVVLVGWLTQLTFAVAYWILPRLERGASRGKEHAAWFSLVALNAGLLLAVAGDLWIGQGGVAVGGALQFASALAFALHAWPRIKPFSSPRKEEPPRR
jgi:hypothetical protein